MLNKYKFFLSKAGGNVIKIRNLFGFPFEIDNDVQIIFWAGWDSEDLSQKEHHRIYSVLDLLNVLLVSEDLGRFFLCIYRPYIERERANKQ